MELKRRGHDVYVITNPLFASTIEGQDLGFIPLTSESAALSAIGNPEVWHLTRGFRIIASLIAPAIGELFHILERWADDSTVVAFSTLAFGARLAQEKLKIPSASVHLQPSVLRTLGDQGMLGNVRLSAAHPRWFKRGLYRLIDGLVLDRHLREPLNTMRRRLGLAPVARIMHRWMHSPDLVLAFFPEWFAAPQSDWPPNLHAVGFPLWDDAPALEMSAARDFLAAGTPPVIITPGSAGSTMQGLFAESVAAVGQLGARAMLVTNYPEQVPTRLPPGVKVFGYLPFSEVLPQAAALIYHGGIGTLAQALRAGLPHLVVPHGYDQFDNGWRIERLGLGSSIPESSFRRRRVVRVLGAMLTDAQLSSRCRVCAGRVDGQAAVAKAADLIEGLRRRA
jgi:rhamnosyltransferase subunit B